MARSSSVGLRDERGLGGEQLLEREPGVEERREAARMELQGAGQPGVQAVGERRIDHGRRALAGAADQHFEALGELVVAQPAADHQRQHGDADLGDVAARRDGPAAAFRAAGRDPQRAPQPLGIPIEGLDRRAKHVVGEHDAALGREQQVLGPQRSAGGIAALAGQHRRGGQQLPQQQHHDADVEGEVLGFGHVEQVGQPPALDVFGDEGGAAEAVGLDPLGPRVRGEPQGRTLVTRSRRASRKARRAASSTSRWSSSTGASSRLTRTTRRPKPSTKTGTDSTMGTRPRVQTSHHRPGVPRLRGRARNRPGSRRSPRSDELGRSRNRAAGSSDERYNRVIARRRKWHRARRTVRQGCYTAPLRNGSAEVRRVEARADARPVR